jgi:hypothetical protein
MTRTQHTETGPSAAAAATDDAPVRIDGAVVHICGVEVTDAVVADHLRSLPADARAAEIAKALAVGIRGLDAMGLNATIDEMNEEVRRVLAAAMEEAQRRLDGVISSGSTSLSNSLDPDVRTSLTARTLTEVSALHDRLLARLDPERTDSHTARLVAALNELLGPDGVLQQRIEEAFDPSETDSGFNRIIAQVDVRFRELRDLVVGEQSRAEEGQRGTAKGRDYEDVLEAALRAEAARIGGCMVERTGQTPGSGGPHAKAGDFVVTLPSQIRIAVEAKNTSRVGLGGAGGILEELDRAMTNRSADWGLCISNEDAFPGEVGAFGVYGNRLLVVDDGGGVLVGVALRWIRAAATVSRLDGSRRDAEYALERLGRLRDLAQHFSRSKRILGTARSNIDSVRDEIDSLRMQLLDLVDELYRSLDPDRDHGTSAVRVA